MGKRKIEVKRRNFKTNYAAVTYHLIRTGEEKRIVMNLGAMTGYVKSFQRHPNCEVLLIEVPHGRVQKTKDWLKKEFKK